MHKRIPVTTAMCGCQGLWCTVVSQQVSRNNSSKTPGTSRETCWSGTRVVPKNKSSAGGDLSGLTTLTLPTPRCDLRCGRINQTGTGYCTGETLRSITPAESKHTVAATNSKQEWGKRGREREIEWLTPCSQPSAGKGCRCVRRWIGRGWRWRTWSSRSHDPRGTFSGAGIDLKGARQGHCCQWRWFNLHDNLLTCGNQNGDEK